MADWDRLCFGVGGVGNLDRCQDCGRLCLSAAGVGRGRLGLWPQAAPTSTYTETLGSLPPEILQPH
jgi:hypothetical protein